MLTWKGLSRKRNEEIFLRALITGINGFVGPYLAECIRNEHVEVFGIDKSIKETTPNMIALDILDSEAVRKAVAEIRPDYVFHLAAQSSVEKSWTIPELTRDINVNGTKNLFDAIVGEGLSPKILVISSAEVYGYSGSEAIKETFPLNPNNPYAESRVEQESLVLDFMKKYNLFVVISRSFIHTGPGQSENFVCSDFARQIVEVEKGKRLEIHVGNLQSARDFTDVRDMVRAYWLAVQKGKSGEIYNLCSGKAYRIQEVLDMLISMSTAKPAVFSDPAKLRPKDTPLILGDNFKFVSDTGWEPEHKFKDTLRDLLEYWRSRI
jgi:GDP-4-dehydro-6-deoxy-D-mannose reductase